MPLLVKTFVLGSLNNNTYLAADARTKEAILIDPSFDSETLLASFHESGLRLGQIWLTHAHFDHVAGVPAVAAAFTPALSIGLHPADLPIWRTGGGSYLFGMKMDLGPDPVLLFQNGQVLQLGDSTLEVRHTPGHTPGHVIFYSRQAQLVFCGDLIFNGSVGRTDLPGGSWDEEMASIQREILPLPPQTRLLSGHGPETTVGDEMRWNPFLKFGS